MRKNSPAWAAPFEVDSTAGTNTGACTVAANDCTLRGAITAASNTTGTDTINFNIPGSGVKTISPTSALPTITDAVTIDGYTQGDGTADDATPNTLAIGNNAHLIIELNGTNAGLSSGLKITGANSTVRGLVINRFQEYGMFINGPGNTIEGNYIGTGVSGTTDLGNSFDGVAVSGTNNSILSNAIFSNGGASTTNLGNDGVTPNDTQDTDNGANNLENFPVIGSASLNADGTVTISGTLDSTPSTTFTVQLFSSP